MQLENNRLWDEYLSNLQISVLAADYTHCTKKWRDIDYIPDYNKFYFIESGEGCLKIGDKEYYPKPGQLFIMPEGIMQSYFVTNPERPFIKHWCHFTASVGGMPFFQLLKYPYFVDVDNAKKLSSRFDKLIGHMETGGVTDPLDAKITMFKIISDFISMSGDSIEVLPTSTPAIRLMPVLEYINKNIDREILVSDLADIAHLSPSYFTRYFQNVMGKSPKNFITQKKLNKAKRLLDMTDYTVVKVAESVGYEDPFHFSNTFKKYMGMAPIEYQKRKR